MLKMQALNSLIKLNLAKLRGSKEGAYRSDMLFITYEEIEHDEKLKGDPSRKNET